MRLSILISLIFAIAMGCGSETAYEDDTVPVPSGTVEIDRETATWTDDGNYGEPREWDGKGVMGCQTIASPEYNTNSGVSRLSASYQATCAACHGAQGRGAGTIPGLPGSLDFETYSSIVREGRRGMPPFEAATYSDADLEADWLALQGLGESQLAEIETGPGPESWSDAEIEQKITAGLEAWRTPGSKGAACAHCHSPDAIEFAIIGYRNEDISRRALLHTPADQTKAIIDLVHAQRLRFGVKEPCDPMSFRPLQPGAEPIRGRNRYERDLKFVRQLYALELFVTRERVDSLEDARRARDSWLSVNPRGVRTSIVFPLWSEDRFHGPEHSSIDDWIPTTPRLAKPGHEADWWSAQDAYLADPSDAALFAMMDARGEFTESDPQFSSSPAMELFDRKYDGIQLVSHFFREEMTGGQGFHQRGPRLFASGDDYGENGDAGGGYGGANPFWWTGNATIGAPVPWCNGNFRGEVPNCMLFPPDAQAELLPGQSAADAWGSLSENWFMMGWVWDPGLVDTAGTNTNYLRGKYWELQGWAEAYFISGLRLMLQVLGENAQLAQEIEGIPPVLHGEFMRQSHMPEQMFDFDRESEPTKAQLYDEFVPVATATNRMWAYLIEAEVDRVGKVRERGNLVEQLETWRDFNREYDEASDTDELFNRVIGKVQNAQEG